MPNEQCKVLDFIQAELGDRKPIIIWYLSPAVCSKLPLSTVEALMNEPKLYSDVARLHDGGMLISILAAGNTTDEIELMLGALGAISKITPSELV